MHRDWSDTNITHRNRANNSSPHSTSAELTTTGLGGLLLVLLLAGIGIPPHTSMHNPSIHTHGLITWHWMVFDFRCFFSKKIAESLRHTAGNIGIIFSCSKCTVTEEFRFRWFFFSHFFFRIVFFRQCGWFDVWKVHAVFFYSVLVFLLCCHRHQAAAGGPWVFPLAAEQGCQTGGLSRRGHDNNSGALSIPNGGMLFQ